MNLLEAAEVIKKLYQAPNSAFSSKYEAEKAWRVAINNFSNALEFENDPKTLEICVLNDPNWQLHVDGRLELLKKTKDLGVSSKFFLVDYYGYLAAHLDPTPEQEEASSQLSILLNNSKK